MAELTVEGQELVLRLSALEKIEAVHGEVRMLASAVRAVEVIDDANEHGIESGATVTPEELDGVFSLVAGGEEIEVVGHAEDAAGERGLIAETVGGQAASIPALVKA